MFFTILVIQKELRRKREGTKKKMPKQIVDVNDKESGLLTTQCVLFRIICHLIIRQFALISAMVLQPMSEIYSRLPTFVLTSHGMPSSGIDNLGEVFRTLGVCVIKSTTSDDTTPEERYKRLKRTFKTRFLLEQKSSIMSHVVTVLTKIFGICFESVDLNF